MSVGIIEAAKALGSRIETNEELCRTCPTTPEIIVAKTGILQRHKAQGRETTSSLALDASRAVIKEAGIGPKDIGMIVACTFVNDYLFPSLAARLHRDLGCGPNVLAYDMQANCSGFISALVAVSDRMEADHSIEWGLIVGAEVLSPYIDLYDAATAPFFSDGAGAVILGHTFPEWIGPVAYSRRGIMSSAFTMDTSNFESVRLTHHEGQIEQAGLATWKQAVTHLPGVIRTAVERAGWKMEDVDVFIPHQANLVLLEFLAARLGWKDKLFTNVATTGNTGAASIAVGIADAYAAGRLHPGTKVVIAGIGAGFSFGAACLEM
jgi:3-oxoacyl-[acyl-carrier-protein] synthase-3